MAWEQVNGPLGAVRADYHAAQIAAAVYNSAKGKRGRRAKISDLVIKWDAKAGPKARPEMDPDQMLRALKGITRQLGGRDLTEPEPEGVTDVDARRPNHSGRQRRRRR